MGARGGSVTAVDWLALAPVVVVWVALARVFFGGRQ